ncbi:hypothetical protein HCC61_04300 [Streptomyces sp. HNM0575]|uniref:hypothetical protein n=1 Tax=Streptomyces sp. HNM0575 TaxID=2716338 RepID=UPI00145D6454|nr:hypothetical protein [Streptomyces sp. HNM0575]NLU71912.1 hypothetical protein [Streptomyces sp. HNM0575]
MSDYFDRLLARHVPGVRGAAAGGPAGGSSPGGGDSSGAGAGAAARPVRVRPRLAGPFERVEALRERSDAGDGLSAPVTGAPAARPVRTGQGEGGVPRTVREIRTERHTVVRDTSAAQAPAPEPARSQRLPDGGRLRPAPGPPRPAGNTPARQAGRPAARDAGPDGYGAPAAGAAPALVARSGEVVARPAGVRPGDDGLSPERGARQQAAARRGGGRRQERVVHVQIGRLEVTAATPPGAARDGAGGTGRQAGGRPVPTVSLDDYLARGRTGERSN